MAETEPVDQQVRYDRVASGYERWWAPVLVDSAVQVLDDIAADVAKRPNRDVLDLGTGTGTLARAMGQRWPHVRVPAIDVSDEMLRAAQRVADAELTADASARIALVQAPADRLPFEDGTFDAAVSSFVLQLVPNRQAVLREVARVLVAGGRFALVTWLADRRPWPPDAVLDDALDEAGFGPREGDDRQADPASVGAVTGGLRRAGFTDVRGRRATLAHPFTPESYLGFVEEFDEEDTFAEMSRRTRERARRRILRELRAMPTDELVFRVPIVYATGLAPAARPPA
jgi:ubiquinone/menaquinone biosynthesis C-methylase UbiE